MSFSFASSTGKTDRLRQMLHQERMYKQFHHVASTTVQRCTFEEFTTMTSKGPEAACQTQTLRQTTACHEFCQEKTVYGSASPTMKRPAAWSHRMPSNSHSSTSNSNLLLLGDAVAAISPDSRFSAAFSLPPPPPPPQTLPPPPQRAANVFAAGPVQLKATMPGQKESLGKQKSLRTCSDTPNKLGIKNVAVEHGHLNELFVNGRWIDDVLRLGTKERNGLARRLNLSSADAKQMKIHSRAFKRRIAQSNYRKKKSKERSDRKNLAEHITRGLPCHSNIAKELEELLDGYGGP